MHPSFSYTKFVSTIFCRQFVGISPNLPLWCSLRYRWTDFEIKGSDGQIITVEGILSPVSGMYVRMLMRVIMIAHYQVHV